MSRPPAGAFQLSRPVAAYSPMDSPRGPPLAPVTAVAVGAAVGSACGAPPSLPAFTRVPAGMPQASKRMLGCFGQEIAAIPWVPVSPSGVVALLTLLSSVRQQAC